MPSRCQTLRLSCSAVFLLPGSAIKLAVVIDKSRDRRWAALQGKSYAWGQAPEQRCAQRRHWLRVFEEGRQALRGPSLVGAHQRRLPRGQRDLQDHRARGRQDAGASDCLQENDQERC